MTNEAYKAKQWLNRNYNDARRYEADLRMLEVMSNRLQSGVSKYETDGTQSHDPDAAKTRHDDALLEYSMQKAKVEKEGKTILLEMAKTRRAIAELSDPAHQAVAIDRYINRLRWQDIAALEHISAAQVHRVHQAMLERMAVILRDGAYV